MVKSIRASRVKRKKPGPPRTTGPGEQVVVRLHEPMLGSIDRWRSSQEDAPTRAEAIRRLVELSLAKQELIKGDQWKVDPTPHPLGGTHTLSKELRR